MSEKITVSLTDSGPVKITNSSWPVVAKASDFNGQHECQANTEWYIKVRQHKDGRTLVYGRQKMGPGGQSVGTTNPWAGWLLAATASKEEVVRKIQMVAEIIGREHLGSECIDDLPAEEI